MNNARCGRSGSTGRSRGHATTEIGAHGRLLRDELGLTGTHVGCDMALRRLHRVMTASPYGRVILAGQADGASVEDDRRVGTPRTVTAAASRSGSHGSSADSARPIRDDDARTPARESGSDRGRDPGNPRATSNAACTGYQSMATEWSETCRPGRLGFRPPSRSMTDARKCRQAPVRWQLDAAGWWKISGSHSRGRVGRRDDARNVPCGFRAQSAPGMRHREHSTCRRLALEASAASTPVRTWRPRTNGVVSRCRTEGTKSNRSLPSQSTKRGFRRRCRSPIVVAAAATSRRTPAS